MFKAERLTPPGEGGEWVRVWTPPPGEPVMDGTVLIVPEGLSAIAMVNGRTMEYGPGAHSLQTGVSRMGSWFGYADADVHVVYVAVGKTRFLPIETSYIISEPRFDLSIRAKVKGCLALSISDAKVFTHKILGGFGTYTDDMEALRQIVLPDLKAALERTQLPSVAALNGDLNRMSDMLTRQMQPKFSRYGLWLEEFTLGGIEIADDQLNHIRSLEQEVLSKRMELHHEAEQIRQIWGGNVDKRTQAEMLRQGGAGMEAVTELVKLLSLLPMLPNSGCGGYGSEVLPDLLGMHSGALPSMPEPNRTAASLPPPLPGRAVSVSNNRAAPPPLPSCKTTEAQTMRCPLCNSVLRSRTCTVCGYTP